MGHLSCYALKFRTLETVSRKKAKPQVWRGKLSEARCLGDLRSLGFGFFSLGGEALVLLSDLVELLHVLEEIGASLERDEELGLLGVAAGTLHGDGSRLDLLESGVVVPNKLVREDLPDKVLGGDDAGGDSVAQSVQLDSLVGLEVLLAEEHVKVGVLLDGDVDLVRLLRTRGGWGILVLDCFSFHSQFNITTRCDRLNN